MTNRAKRLTTSALGVAVLALCCLPQTEPIRSVLLPLASALVMAGVPTWGHGRDRHVPPPS
jgi:hypothetical protein